MKQTEITSMQRVLTTLEHKEPDRVPLLLLVTVHGAKELGVSIKAKYRHDCIYGFFYAPIEVEAWGGEVIYPDDGPPNSGLPFIGRFTLTMVPLIRGFHSLGELKPSPVWSPQRLEKRAVSSGC